MKVYIVEPQKMERLTIKNNSEPIKTVNIIETTHEETITHIIKLFSVNMVKSDKTKTTIDIRRYIGATAFETQRVSLFGISAKEVEQTILNSLK